MAASNSAEQIEPRVSAVTQAVHGELQDSENFYAARHAEDIEKIAAGTHRFDIHPEQAIFSRPRGFLVDREEDRLQRLARNAAAIKVWERRYVEVTDDGYVVRERKMPKPKLKLVKSDGRQ